MHIYKKGKRFCKIKQEFQLYSMALLFLPHRLLNQLKQDKGIWSKLANENTNEPCCSLASVKSSSWSDTCLFVGFFPGLKWKSLPFSFGFESRFFVCFLLGIFLPSSTGFMRKLRIFSARSVLRPLDDKPRIADNERSCSFFNLSKTKNEFNWIKTFWRI